VVACASHERLGDDCFQCSHERRPHAAQLVPVGQRKAPKPLFSPRSHPNQHLASINIATVPCRESSLDQAVHQFHRAMMPDLQSLGESPNRRPLCSRQALDGKQELVLLRLDTSGPRFALAEGEEATDLMPKLGQGLVVNRGNHIVERYNDSRPPRGTAFLTSVSTGRRLSAVRSSKSNGFSSTAVAQGMTGTFPLTTGLFIERVFRSRAKGSAAGGVKSANLHRGRGAGCGPPF
jgi:hypothetical protein